MENFLEEFKAFVAAQPADEKIDHSTATPCAVDRFLTEFKDIQSHRGCWPGEVENAMLNIGVPGQGTLYRVLNYIPLAESLAGTYGALSQLLEKSVQA